jgi:hypothetical protein
MDLLANPSVVGVFERHVPLVEAAVQRFGCVATLKKGSADGMSKGGNYEAGGSLIISTRPTLNRKCTEIGTFVRARLYAHMMI